MLRKAITYFLWTLINHRTFYIIKNKLSSKSYTSNAIECDDGWVMLDVINRNKLEKLSRLWLEEVFPTQKPAKTTALKSS
mmetsp:Transcript_47430/g.92562  ORF Transcript_47430/g.92562 Transcript_47430/m.92562 type:complete len:80 (-) Transcript_47430:41-280(-)